MIKVRLGLGLRIGEVTEECRNVGEVVEGLSLHEYGLSKGHLQVMSRR